MNRLTPDDIDAAIASADYYQFPGTTVTVCCLTLINDFNVIGTSACIDPHQIDVEIGRMVARDDASSKIWELEGYRLKQRLADQVATADHD